MARHRRSSAWPLVGGILAVGAVLIGIAVGSGYVVDHDRGREPTPHFQTNDQPGVFDRLFDGR